MGERGEEKLLTRANGSPRVSALPVIFQRKRQFSTVFSDVVRKYGFIGSLNESLTRRSITYTSGMKNEGGSGRSSNVALLKLRERIFDHYQASGTKSAESNRRNWII